MSTGAHRTPSPGPCLVLGLLVAGLASAATAAEPAPSQPSAAPAGPDWMLSVPKSREPGRAQLVFADPEAGAPRLSLSCDAGSGMIVAAFDVGQKLASRQRNGVWIDAIGRPEPWAVSVSVASVTQTTTLRGAARHNAATSGSSIAVEIATAAPVVAEWRKTGALRFRAALEERQEPPAPRAMVAKFLRVCK